MTTHYVDLTVVPDAETGVAPLLGALFDRLHRYLARQRIDHLGVSFPQYSVVPRTIGAVLRLHASQPALEAFMAVDWLGAVRDHVRSSAIAPVPAEAPHRCVRRRQFKSNVARMRRRRMKRKGESAEQAARALPDSAAEKPHLPYLHLHSQSTAQRYCLFIELGPLQSAPVAGLFNRFGLSERSTVPWF